MFPASLRQFSILHFCQQICSDALVLDDLCRYQPKEIIVTENGLSVKGEDAMSDDEAVRDSQRVEFFKQYVGAATDAVLVDKVRHRTIKWFFFVGSKKRAPFHRRRAALQVVLSH